MDEMRKYTQGTASVLTELRCNRCGKKMELHQGIVREGVFSAQDQWGYFSDKDGEKHSFDLCERCYDEMIKDFAIMPDVAEENELI